MTIPFARAVDVTPVRLGPTSLLDEGDSSVRVDQSTSTLYEVEEVASLAVSKNSPTKETWLSEPTTDTYTFHADGLAYEAEYQAIGTEGVAAGVVEQCELQADGSLQALAAGTPSVGGISFPETTTGRAAPFQTIWNPETLSSPTTSLALSDEHSSSTSATRRSNSAVSTGAPKPTGASRSALSRITKAAATATKAVITAFGMFIGVIIVL